MGLFGGGKNSVGGTSPSDLKKAKKEARLEAKRKKREEARLKKQGGKGEGGSGPGGVKEEQQPVIKKRSQMLSSVLKESVPASSLALIRKNDPFMISDNQAFCMMIHTKDVGGFDAHCAKDDEDKGQFLEQIHNDSIHIYVDADMLQGEKFLLIPDKETLDNLSEYGFVSDPDVFKLFYPTIVSWSENGDMEFTELSGCPRDYDWLVGIMDEKLDSATEFSAILGDDYMDDEPDDEPSSVKDMVSGMMAGGSSGGEEDGAESGDNGPDSAEVESEDGYISLAQNEGSGDFSEDDIPDSVDWVYEDLYEESGSEAPRHPIAPASMLITCPSCGVPCPEDGPCPECGWTPASEENTEDTVEEMDEQLVMEAVSHTFYHGDLDLEITAGPFDLQFLSKDRFVPINEDRGDGWLDGYISQVVKNANSELYHIHKKNILQVRDHFLQNMDASCGVIADKVSVSVEGNAFYEMMQDIDERTDAKIKASADEIKRIRDEKQARWDKELKQTMESASAKAAKEYNDRYAKAHDAELASVDAEVRSRIQSEREDDVREVNDMRREEAARLLNVQYSEALVTAGEEYAELMAVEEELRKKVLDSIQAYIDTHREEEVARISTLHQQVVYQQELKDTENEMSRRLSEQSSQYEAMCEQLRQEIQNGISNTKRICAEYDSKLADAAKRDTENWEKINGLMDQCATMEQQITERVSRDYEDRIRAMEQSKAATEQRLHDTKEANKQYNRISVVVWIAISVMTLLIGLFVGSKWLGAPQGSPNYTLRLETDGSVTETEAEPVSDEIQDVEE